MAGIDAWHRVLIDRRHPELFVPGVWRGVGKRVAVGSLAHDDEPEVATSGDGHESRLVGRARFVAREERLPIRLVEWDLRCAVEAREKNVAFRATRPRL